MNQFWQDILKEDLDKRKSEFLFRQLKNIEKSYDSNIQINNKSYINFASNDYLGYANDKRIIEAGYDYSFKWGAGSKASRLVTGSIDPFKEVEDKFATWLGKDSGLFFNSGYNANVGILSSLANRDTVIFTDRLNHASIYDGAVLSRARIIRFDHCDIDHLASLLEKNKGVKRKIIIVDAVFSMEGDIFPIEKLIRFAKRYNALTIVDEAHSVGLFGDGGRGLTFEKRLINQIDIVMCTLGKAFGVFGALVLADRLVIDYLINTSRSFIFTTALPPFVIGSVIKAHELINEEGRGSVTLKKAEHFRQQLIDLGLDIGNSRSQIIPIIVKTNENAVNLMEYLMEKGIYAPAIRPPTVPENTSRVRISLSYAHSDNELEKLYSVLKKWSKNI